MSKTSSRLLVKKVNTGQTRLQMQSDTDITVLQVDLSSEKAIGNLSVEDVERVPVQ